ncbi:recombination-associated protein RdgC [Parendozoicomonas haliclonae]|uniref:Recombination-associated protein RdgC n=1 Tax=Parendozoicomonas haliclonae TaxID=1960125 RepID=A0A1X7AQU5_9GAMM|nr:recombination-associated protein RdgC [Parendozoicomonas haliclonae]SMA50460.1 Recombination-associated protein RdgC [Parendozoicomonas haliclonae]
MWFKNLILYRFNQETDITSHSLEESLGQQPFRPCGKTELASYGWVPPISGTEGMVHASGRFLTFAAKKEERILPTSVVRDAVKEKVEQIEAEQGRQVFKKEKDQIKDEMTLSLLPRAFTRSNITRAYIDTRDGWLIVDASSFRKAEELTSALRGNLGSLPVVPPALKQSPAATMTNWLESHGSTLPRFLSLGDECELKDLGEEGGSIRCKRQDLLADEILSHLNTGMQVSKLALHWNEALNCILGDDLIIRRVKFTDELQEQSEALNADDEASRFDADFTLMAGTLSEFLKEMIEGLGGEEEKGAEWQTQGSVSSEELAPDTADEDDAPF